MKRLLPLLGLTLLLVACVDTTGISADSSKKPRGNVQSVVVLTEYADLQCPACKAANELLAKPLFEKFGTQVRFEYKHFPLRSIHRYTMELAESAECAADQGKFWEFVDMAFENQDQLKSGIWETWAGTLVADKDLFHRCVASGIKEKAVTADYDAGIAAQVQGTPTFFVNGRQVQATMEDLSAAINKELSGAAQKL